MPQDENKAQPDDPFKPYKGRFEEYHALPAKGRAKDDIVKDRNKASRRRISLCRTRPIRRLTRPANTSASK